jgi:hypothetical protein
MMTLAEQNKAERGKWLEEHWAGRPDVNGITKEIAALTLQAFGSIPGVTQEDTDARNKELRERIFAERFGGRLSCEGVEIPDGALILQWMGLIPSV